MNEPALSNNGGASPDERDSVRCDAWVAELETALTHAERAMAGAMKALDFAVWDEIEDAVDCLRAAVESSRRRSATDKLTDRHAENQ